jgi:hypothetical protein
MAISLFKTKNPTPPPAARPALAALRDHLAIASGLTRQIEAINARLALVQQDIRNHEQAQARLQATRAACDLALADVRYKAAAPAPDCEDALPDLEESKIYLANLEANAVPIAENARIAKMVAPRLEKDIAALVEERNTLKPATDRLLWEACIEAGAQLATEYQAAVASMRAVARKTFSAFAAADAVGKASGYGIFYGSERYRDLHLPLPAHPAFDPTPLLPEAAQAARNADLRTLNLEAEQLIERLLNPEVGDDAS